ncbi:U3 small nucleolar RNA-associated protein 6 [Cladobotryum mycophilum]|uniref:U3 small nucleolar RNA-associated protein 6 n=1 Tax=Cladobotryum mycophilum TaxID=491253 RepID=A0ABR0STU5_9HYPO
MAGVAEKARFYLERSVPQLREWEEKELFTKEEIRSIVKKRNDFEHKILSPGNLPSEWASYAQWEQSLESLRSKRCKRLKIRHLESAHAGQGRVLAIYDRGVNRHPGSAALWREYLAYTAHVNAAKRWRKTMTKALRMMPKNPDMWVTAGRRYASNGDMASARSFFMRGCRFCTKDCTLWVEYARSEMEWLEKIEKKNAKNGGKTIAPPPPANDDDELRLLDSDDEDEEGLPEPSRAEAKVIDKSASQQLQNSPAMDGAIPMAIFEISRKQTFYKPEVAETFFFMFASFQGLSVQSKISQHVLDAMDEQFPNDPSTCNCHLQQPILGVSPYTAEFPRSLGQVLSKLGSYLEATTDRNALEQKTLAWIDGYLGLQNLDEDIRSVLEYARGKLEVSNA